MKEPINLTTASLALLTSAFWGGVVVAVKFSEDTLSPGAVAAVRFSLAGCFMFAWCLWRRIPLRLNTEEARLAGTVASLLFIQILLFNFAVHLSNSSHGALLISSFVIWVALIDHFITAGDKFTSRKLLGMSLAAIGVACTLLSMTTSDSGGPEASRSQFDAPTIIGDLLMLCSGLVLGIKVVFTKYAVSRTDSNKLIFWHHVFGTALFGLFAVTVEGVPDLDPEIFTPSVILALLYQGLVVGGFCFGVQAALLARHTATSIAMFGFATPIFGVIAALAFRGDPFSWWLLIAGICVAAGIYLANQNR